MASALQNRDCISKQRVRNGYGTMTSAFSASHVGLFDATSEKRKAQTASFQEQFTADAAYQLAQNKLSHPFKKGLHLQKFYPETVRMLDNEMAHHKAPPARKQPAPSASVVHFSEMRQRQAQEYQFVHKRMEYNRHRSKEAAVDKIITGQVLATVIRLRCA
jgi:translation initiation factor 2B subunit (eIF-2B alpha/beta/delta family)